MSMGWEVTSARKNSQDTSKTIGNLQKDLKKLTLVIAAKNYSSWESLITNNSAG